MILCLKFTDGNKSTSKAVIDDNILFSLREIRKKFVNITLMLPPDHSVEITPASHLQENEIKKSEGILKRCRANDDVAAELDFTLFLNGRLNIKPSDGEGIGILLKRIYNYSARIDFILPEENKCLRAPLYIKNGYSSQRPENQIAPKPSPHAE